MRMLALLIILLVCLVGCEPSHSVRIATFNVAMGLEESGQLGQALANGNDPRLQQLAAILQEVHPDIALLNEFDFDPMVDAATLLNDNYLAHGQDPIHYPYHFQAPVTGCGVFWPARGEAGHEWVEVSDHRLVWLDISL